MSDDEREDEAPPSSEAPSSEAPASVVSPVDRATGSLPPLREAFLVAAAVTAATFVAIYYAFDPERAGTASMLYAMGALYAVLAAVTLFRFTIRGELARVIRPASGDLAIGALTAGALYGLAQLAEMTLRGTARAAWTARVYIQVHGDDLDIPLVVTLSIFVIAALEELVWRGLVMRSLQVAMSGRAALVVTAILIGVAHIPAAYGLRDPTVGWNPLVPFAAFGCGLVWGLLFLRTKRIVPSLFAHAFFTYAVVEWPLWRP